MMLSFPELILASKSPRRQELLRSMGIEFSTVLKEVDESYPEGLDPAEVAVFIAKKKAEAFEGEISESQIVLTADTIVCINGQVLGKPATAAEAVDMLRLLSGASHEVVTGVTLKSANKYESFFDSTTVVFNELSDDEIYYYVNTYSPLDKAGAYGIQEWIGSVAINRIEGSYNNVVGLPTEKVYRKLKSFL